MRINLLTLFVIFHCNNGNQNDNKVKEFLKRINSENYQNGIRPGFSKGEIDKVEMNMYINSFGSISESLMEYTISIFMRQSWRDERLRHNLTKLTLSYHYGDILWVPDLFFRNEKKAYVHRVIHPNKLITVSEDGRVTYSQRITLKLSCNMILLKFPVDTQVCPLYLESFGYTTEELMFYWKKKNPVQLNIENELPKYELKDMIFDNCTQNYLTGNFTCIKTVFTLERQYDFYIIQFYLPSILIVMISWISFWIDNEAIPARISLGLLTVLTQITQMSGLKNLSPAVSYVTTLDVWNFACLIFTCAAFIEFSIVNGVKYGVKDDKTTIEEKEQSRETDGVSTTMNHQIRRRHIKMKKFSCKM
ncbi:DgyrCDS10702 [Dimorphilus gyrociliatus]|uniref:Gamma-aminobutyric acid receptor subunit beta n=1 Tax=Dimorphilus gyrociliatus TaxID=2664684 RepID=A0A7I8W2E0_9ANNE|nr:DgyrCDS10702 [Dimorphilus gyrociliatus]